MGVWGRRRFLTRWPIPSVTGWCHDQHLAHLRDPTPMNTYSSLIVQYRNSGGHTPAQEFFADAVPLSHTDPVAKAERERIDQNAEAIIKVLLSHHTIAQAAMVDPGELADAAYKLACSMSSARADSHITHELFEWNSWYNTSILTFMSLVRLATLLPLPVPLLRIRLWLLPCIVSSTPLSRWR